MKKYKLRRKAWKQNGSFVVSIPKTMFDAGVIDKTREINIEFWQENKEDEE